MKIVYRNNFGQEVNLLGEDFRLSASDLLGFGWTYDTVNTSGIAGPAISKVYKTILEKELTLSVWAGKLNDLLKVTEPDIVAGLPGKLYVDEQYLSCYIIAGSPEYHASGLLVLTVKVVAAYPYWCSERRYVFTAGRTSSSEDYPYDYPYEYLSTLETDDLINAHYAPTPFQLYIYGPCTEPALYINNHLYQVHVTLEENEYVVVDSRERTLVKVDAARNKSNIFDTREKESDIFAAIPSGLNPMVWDGTFFFDVVLIAERSVPVWTLS